MALTDNQHIANWQAKTKNIGAFKTIQVSSNFVDCFFSDGWEDFCRIKIDRKTKSWFFSDHRNKSSVRLSKNVESIIKELL